MIFFCPVLQPVRDQFRTIIDADLRWAASPGDQGFQNTNNTFRRQGSVHFNPQDFPVEVIQDIQRAKGSATGQAGVKIGAECPEIIGLKCPLFRAMGVQWDLLSFL